MSSDQHTLYARAGELFAPAIARLARAFERDREKARDLEQDIHAEPVSYTHLTLPTKA